VSTLASLRLIAMLERSRSLLPYAAYRTALAAVALAALRRRARSASAPPKRTSAPAPPRMTVAAG